jgi:hypothetical protein
MALRFLSRHPAESVFASGEMKCGGWQSSTGPLESYAKVLKYRNALAHGFKPIDFDRILVTELINTTKRLLQSTSTPQST